MKGERFMLQFLTKRLIYMVITLIFISIVAFFIIQLPPGDYVTSLAAGLRARGDKISNDQIEALRIRWMKYIKPSLMPDIVHLN